MASTAPDRKLIKASHVRQYEPLPASLGAPADCDWITYMRYRHREGPRSPSRAGAVLVGMQGFMGGGLLLDILARNVVAAAAERGKHLEFWALDRRANCIEDRVGLEYATRVRDYRPALGYYFGGREVGGRRFAGFKSSDEVPYLAEFGLAQTMRDEYAVITRGIPDPALRARKVFCGGHSLGGSLTAAFASWDFDGNPETMADAGYNQCAGYFGLDTVVSNNLGGGFKEGGAKGDAFYAAETEAIRSGAAPRYVASVPPFTPELLQAVGIVGLAAYHQGEESGLLQEAPDTEAMNGALRTFLSRDAADFAVGDPREFRLTNEALLGTFVDDNAQSIPALQASVGTYDGGTVVEKDFPAPNAIKDIPGIGQELAALLPNTLIVPGASETRLMIPATRREPLYRWRKYDAVGAADAPRQADSLGQPFTSPASEVTDIHQFARSLFEGPIDSWEQYFPTRLIADDGAFLAGGRSGDLSAVAHEDGPQRRPYLELVGSEGVVSLSAQGPLEPGAKPRRRVILDGYNHLDVSTAAAPQNDGKPEGSSVSLVCFVLEVVDGLPPSACAPLAGPRRCLARRSPIGPRNIGRIRIGYTRRRLLQLPVRPASRRARVFRYCVKGRAGRVTALFSRRGRVELVATTARGHGNRQARVRSRATAFRRAYPGRRRIGRGLYRVGPRSPRLYALRRGRVRLIAVAGRRLLGNRPALKRALVRAAAR